jgi:hypothetical protein
MHTHYTSLVSLRTVNTHTWYFLLVLYVRNANYWLWNIQTNSKSVIKTAPNPCSVPFSAHARAPRSVQQSWPSATVSHYPFLSCRDGYTKPSPIWPYWSNGATTSPLTSPVQAYKLYHVNKMFPVVCTIKSAVQDVEHVILRNPIFTA